MGGVQGIVEIIVLSHSIQRETTHEMEVPSTRRGTRCPRIHIQNLEESHQVR